MFSDFIILVATYSFWVLIACLAATAVVLFLDTFRWRDMEEPEGWWSADD